MVAVVDHGVAEDGGAQLPSGAHGVVLAVGAGLEGDEPEAVGGGDLGGAGGGVAPANGLPAGAHEVERVELQPIGAGRRRGRPTRWWAFGPSRGVSGAGR